MEEDEDLWQMKKPRVSDLTAVPDENYHADMSMDVDMDDQVHVKTEPRDLDDEEDEMEIKVRESRPLATSTKANRRVVNSSSVKHTLVKPEPISVKVELGAQPIRQPQGKALAPGAAHWSAVQESLIPQAKVSELEEVKVSSGSIKAENVLEANGNLRIFWLDFMEQDGVIHLVGKVLDRQSGKYVSACLSINGIKRNLFVKPRPKRYCEPSRVRLMLTSQLAGSRPTSKSQRPTCIKTLIISVRKRALKNGQPSLSTESTLSRIRRWKRANLSG